MYNFVYINSDSEKRIQKRYVLSKIEDLVCTLHTNLSAKNAGKVLDLLDEIIDYNFPDKNYKKINDPNFKLKISNDLLKRTELGYRNKQFQLLASSKDDMMKLNSQLLTIKKMINDENVVKSAIKKIQKEIKYYKDAIACDEDIINTSKANLDKIKVELEKFNNVEAKDSSDKQEESVENKDKKELNKIKKEFNDEKDKITKEIQSLKRKITSNYIKIDTLNNKISQITSIDFLKNERRRLVKNKLKIRTRRKKYLSIGLQNLKYLNQFEMIEFVRQLSIKKGFSFNWNCVDDDFVDSIA